MKPATVPVPATDVEDPIGDLGDGEGHRYLGADAEHEPSETQAGEAEPEETPQKFERVQRGTPVPEPELHLERLQKILSQAGIASRRHAEEMIEAGRVFVNGQSVTQLGAKADPDRDHIRVDGKLIQRAERHRTFALNKPKGYVTTVSDPEGRATVMDFFAKTRERLYPVGRLDYLSEGLLLMTNDGELANLLTRASSQVEKTYVVKVAGQLSPEEMDRLREGVSIEKGEPGSARVRSAPAEVRLIRPGNNPWYEVVLIEGRNREIRKMFSSTGHFVEKIRRVGYGPLALDVEPGLFRELTAEELKALRLTAEGRIKARRPKSAVMLPKEAGVPSEERGDFRKQRRDGPPRGDARERRPFKPVGERSSSDSRGPRDSKPFGSRPPRPPFAPRREEGAAPGAGFDRGPRKFDRPRDDRGGAKPFGSRPPRPPFAPRREEGAAPGAGFDRGPRKFDRPRDDRGGAKPFGSRPPRPPFAPRREGGAAPGAGFDRGPRKFDRPRDDRGGAKPFGSRPPRPPFAPRREGGAAPGAGFDRGPRKFDRPRDDRGGAKPFGSRPPRPPFAPRREGGAAPGAGFDRGPRKFDRGPRPQSGSEDRPRRDFKPRVEGAEKFKRPDRVSSLHIEPVVGGTESGPPRFDRKPGGTGRGNAGFTPRAGGSRPSGPGPGGARSGGFGKRPGGFRKRPETGSPRDDRK